MKVFIIFSGAHKYSDYVKKSKMKVKKLDELECLVYGLRSMIKRNDCCFTLANARFGGDVGEKRSTLLTIPITLNRKHGVLVVNIGSGVSILQ